MATILQPDKTWYNSLTDALQQGAAGYGQGMGAGLQALAQNKMNQLVAQQNAEREQAQATPLAKSLGHPEWSGLGVEGLKAIALQKEKENFEIQKQDQLMQALGVIKPGQQPVQTGGGVQPTTGNVTTSDLDEAIADNRLPSVAQPRNVQQAPMMDENRIEQIYNDAVRKAQAVSTLNAPLGASMLNNASRAREAALSRLQSERKESVEAEKFKFSKQETERKETKPIIEDFNNGLSELQRNASAREFIQNGDFSNPTWVAITDMFPGSIGQAFRTGDTAALRSMGPNAFLASVKPIFGPQISESDITQMYSAIVSNTNNKDQNLAILDFMDKVANNKIDRGDMWYDIKKKNPQNSVYENLELLDQEWGKKLRGEVAATKERSFIPKGMTLANSSDESFDPRANKGAIQKKLLPDGKIGYEKSYGGDEWVPGSLVNGEFKPDPNFKPRLKTEFRAAPEGHPARVMTTQHIEPKEQKPIFEDLNAPETPMPKMNIVKRATQSASPYGLKDYIQERPDGSFEKSDGKKWIPVEKGGNGWVEIKEKKVEPKKTYKPTEFMTAAPEERRTTYKEYKQKQNEEALKYMPVG
jgi:hypothetical protein